MLCHSGVEVVLYHEHDGSCLLRLVGILIDGACIHLIAGTIAVHIDAAVVVQFFGKFRSQVLMQFLGEIPQGIAQSQFLFLFSEDFLTLGRMVDFLVVWFYLRQHIRYACTYFVSKLFFGHHDCYDYI